MIKNILYAIVAAVPAAASLTAPGAAGAAQATVTVRSETGWQATTFELAAGQPFSVTYRSGTWTVDHRSFPRIGPEGYASTIDQQIVQGCKILADQPYGRLLARTGDNMPFVIAGNGSFTAPVAGLLARRINDHDQCLGDNAGALRLTASARPTGGPGSEPSAAGAVLYTADWSSGLNGWTGAGSWKTLRGELLNDGTTGDTTPILAPYDTGQVSDYAVEARIRVVRSGDYYGSFGLAARRLTGGGGYYGQVFGRQSTARIGTEAGPPTDDVPFASEDGWHNYRLEVDGNVVTFLADGARIATITDNRYLTGGLTGLFCKNHQIEVASYRILRLR